MHVVQSSSSSRYLAHFTQVAGGQRAETKSPAWMPLPTRAHLRHQGSTLYIPRKALQHAGPPEAQGLALRALLDKDVMRTFPHNRKLNHFTNQTPGHKIATTLRVYCCYTISHWRTGSTFCCFQTPVPSTKTDHRILLNKCYKS